MTKSPLARFEHQGGLVVETHRLDNGLELLLVPDRTAPIVAYQTWYRVGSSHERAGKTGLAHLFEHLMFNQTANLAAGEFDRRMEAVGGETNAATWVDWTYYRDSVPASALELAVRLESDRMAHLTLTEKQLESEREVVTSERRMRVDDDVEGFLSEELFRRTFSPHPYHWPTIGWMEDIQAYTADDCRRFYSTYYAPNNATIVVVGDFDPQAARALVEAHYGHIPAAELAAPPRATTADTAISPRMTWAKPVAADRGLLAWRTPAQGHPDWLPLQLCVEVLLGGPSSRLHKRLIVDDELASTVSGFLLPTRHPGAIEISVAMTREHRFPEAEAAIVEELERLHREPISAAELAKCHSRYEASYWHELETFDGRAEALGHYHTVLGDFRALFAAGERVQTITAEDLQRVARTYLRTDAQTVVVAEPSGEPDADDDGAEGDDA